MNHSNDPIDLLLLQTFFEIARSGSVTRAAQVLGRSQPAISHRLAALEDDLGVPLFEKVGRSLRLTDYGRLLQSRTQDLMALSRGIRDSLRSDDQDVQGQVTIGTLPTVAAHLLVPHLAELFASHPKITVIFRFGYVPRLIEELRSGELDLVLSIGAIDQHGLDIKPLGTAALACVMSPKLARTLGRCAQTLAPSALDHLRYLTWGGTIDATFDIIDRFAKQHRLNRRHTPCVPNIESLRELAIASAGYTILPAYTVRQEQKRKRLVTFRLTGFPPPVKAALLTRKNQVQTPALRAVKTALLKAQQTLAADASVGRD